MKKDEKFEDWCNSVGGNAQIDMELSMARTHLSQCWNHQQKKIDELEKKVTELSWDGALNRAEKQIQDLESKLAKAVECIEHIYEEVEPDEGDEVDFLYGNIFEYCRQTLAQLEKKGEGE